MILSLYDYMECDKPFSETVTKKAIMEAIINKSINKILFILDI